MNGKLCSVLIAGSLFFCTGVLNAANQKDTEERTRYELAEAAYQTALRAEDSARGIAYASGQADYYQIAMQNYNAALKDAQRSIEELEKLTRREQYERERMIDDCRMRIEICQKRYDEALAMFNVEELRRSAYKYMIAGFNYATSGNKVSAQNSWNESLRLYKEALNRTDDLAEKEVINSKISEILYYMERYL
ncbi:MAG: hypothetical protein V1727_06115 [Candidatus Omnitrophota bacterium]